MASLQLLCASDVRPSPPPQPPKPPDAWPFIPPPSGHHHRLQTLLRCQGLHLYFLRLIHQSLHLPILQIFDPVRHRLPNDIRNAAPIASGKYRPPRSGRVHFFPNLHGQQTLDRPGRPPADDDRSFLRPSRCCWSMMRDADGRSIGQPGGALPFGAGVNATVGSVARRVADSRRAQSGWSFRWSPSEQNGCFFLT